MWLLHRLGHHVAGRHLYEPALDATKGDLSHATDGHFEPLQPRFSLDLAIDAESGQLGVRGRFSGSELDPPVGHQVEHGDPFRDASRMVVTRGGLNDAVADAHSLGTLAGHGQEHLWCTGVRILLQKMVLHLPEVLDPETVGQFDLVQGIGDQLLLAGLAPGPGQLVLVEDTELHCRLLCIGIESSGWADPRGIQPSREMASRSTAVPSSIRTTDPNVSISSMMSSPSARPARACSISPIVKLRFS